MTPNLCLGTAQFGFDYGITNKDGQVQEEEVKSLLNQAAAAGIRWIDTAYSYGCSEAVLGRTLPIGHEFSLMTKLSAWSKTSFGAQDITYLENAFTKSCNSLGCDYLDAFLLHNPSDLAKPGAEHLLEWLLSLRERGLVSRLGVSIYAAQDLDGLPRELLDLVQLPLSLYDQRMLLNGTVSRLLAQGTAIYARSLYLQGLLLIPATNWPRWVDPALIKHHKSLEELAIETGSSLLDLVVGFAREQSDLEGVVVGLCSCSELQELLDSWNAINPWRKSDWRSWHFSDSTILDPRSWPN